MGTNYYFHPAPCEHCGLYDKGKRVHIGKSSWGWCFGLHVGESRCAYEWDDVGLEAPRDLDDWIALFATPGWQISNEDGKPVSVDEMLSIIKNRGDNPKRNDLKWAHVAGHGPGPWDYLTGEFS